MREVLVITDNPRRFDREFAVCRAVSAEDYLAGRLAVTRRTTLINLCSDYSYLGIGYYCSLFAEARGDRMLPSAEAMLDLGWKRIYRRALGDLGAKLTKIIARHAKRVGAAGELDPLPNQLLVCFGQTGDARFKDFAVSLFDHFRCPVLLARLDLDGDGRVRDVDVPKAHKLDSDGKALFARSFTTFIDGSKAPKTRKSLPPRYTLAVLQDPNEAMPPSNGRAYERLKKSALASDMRVDLITRKDFARLPEYDALFIRETTALDHHTYRFARRAQAEGIPCIDDATSILRCTNKVYLAELLAKHQIPAPRTTIVSSGTLERALDETALPAVLKVPDGAFSRGVRKAETRDGFRDIASRMLKDSDLILVQDYVPTDFDWRIGVLAGAPLFASKYFMARGHWQIVKHESDGSHDEGLFETVAVEDAPQDIVAMAVKAANLIGNGLYGVDMKLGPNGPIVIEVNDNPNLDGGIEDKILKQTLWDRIVAEFIRQIERR